MYRTFLSLGVGVGILFASASAAYAQRGHGGQRGGGGGPGRGFGGGMMPSRSYSPPPPSIRSVPSHPDARRVSNPHPVPVRQPAYHPPRISDPNARRSIVPASSGSTSSKPVRTGVTPIKRSDRVSVTGGSSRTVVASTRGPVGTRIKKGSSVLALSAGAKPTARQGNGSKNALALTGSSRGSTALRANRNATKVFGGQGRKQVGKGVLPAANQAKIQKALNRLRARIENALLLSALANMSCGQPLTGAQCICLVQYINSPDCGLTADEQGCVQQCVGNGDNSDTGDTGDNGDNGGEGATGDANENGSDTQDDGGVLVRAVDKEAAAAQAGLRAGDTILSFGDVRTRTFDDLQNAVRQADGAVKVVFINGENNAVEYLMVEPQGGRIGVTCE